MSPAKPATSALRFVTPGQLVMCLLLFFLPWVNVQCNMNAGGGMDFSDSKVKAPKSLEAPMWVTVATQSGFQVASGGVSFAGADFPGGGGKQKGAGPKESGEGAPLLWLFPVAALGGIIVGFAMPSTGARKMILAGCCGLALLSAGGQAVIGFPINKAAEESAMKDSGGGLGGGGTDPASKATAEAAAKIKDAVKNMVKVSYSMWFYVVLLFCIGGLVTALLEPTTAGGGSKKSKYDFDDEDEDEAPLSLDDEPEEKPKKREKREKPDRGDKGGGSPPGDNPFSNLE
jgi:hypothetical protein